MFKLPSQSRIRLVFTGILIGMVMTTLFSAYSHLITLSRPMYMRPDARLKVQGPNKVSAEKDYIKEREEIRRNVKPVFTDIDAVINNIRVVCFVVTYPPKHNTSAKGVKETWGKRCSRLVFISTLTDPSLPTVAVQLQEDRNHLWGKTKLGFQHLYKEYFKDGDWFMKADDDTYVIMENLKLVLSQYDPEMPVHLGCQYNKMSPQGYMSGGSGYVLSKEALQRAVEEGFPNKEKCKQADTGAEDADMGKCLYQLGVKSVDSRDAEGRHRFFPLSIENYAHGHIAEGWFWKNIYYPFKEEEPSSSPISWHYVPFKHMYVLEYLIYKVRPYGITSPIQNIQEQILYKQRP